MNDIKQEAQNTNNYVSTKKNNSLLWSILFVIIAFLCIYTVISLNKSFSFTQFIDFIKNAKLFWLFLAIFCMILYIICEGVAIKVICKSLGHDFKGYGFHYAAADFYFSAITPSATGGQPASAYFMLKDKIPPSVITASLIYNLQLYTASLVIIALVTLIFGFKSFLTFSLFAKFLIIVGFITQIGLIIVFAFVLYKRSFLYKICYKVLSFLNKIHLIHNKEKKLQKLVDMMDKYQSCANLLKGKRIVLFKVLGLNILQRSLMIVVPICIFLATGSNFSSIFDIWCVEVMVSIGATFIPVPGSMGITDYLMLNGFSKIMSMSMAANLELLTRVISFYSCAIICGVTVAIKYWQIRRGSKNDRIL